MSVALADPVLGSREGGGPDVVLALAGVALGVWTSVEINVSIESAARDFTLGLTERTDDPSALAAGRAYPVNVRERELCTVRIGDTTVLTGRVEAYAKSFDKASLNVDLSGRSLTGDIVDSSAVGGPWNAPQPLEAIAAQLTAPHGVTVVTDVPTGEPLNRYRIARGGETVYEAIERAAALRPLLITDNALGQLVLTRAGQLVHPTPLVVGGTATQVIAGSLEVDGRDVFSTYVCRGQRASDAASYGAGLLASSGPVLDTSRPTSARTLILQAEHGGGITRCRERAQWEAATRAGRSRRVRYTLDSWRDQLGLLWQPNRRVEVNDPILGVTGQWLVVACSYRYTSEDAETCEIELGPPYGYEPFAPSAATVAAPRAPKVAYAELSNVERGALTGTAE